MVSLLVDCPAYPEKHVLKNRKSWVVLSLCAKIITTCGHSRVFLFSHNLKRCRIGPFGIPPAGSSVIPRDLDLFLSDTISSLVIAQWLRLVPTTERLLQRSIVPPHCYQKYLKLPYRRRIGLEYDIKI
jgi:hypothetical protein